jgi:hypothetical protein
MKQTHRPLHSSREDSPECVRPSTPTPSEHFTRITPLQQSCAIIGIGLVLATSLRGQNHGLPLQTIPAESATRRLGIESFAGSADSNQESLILKPMERLVSMKPLLDRCATKTPEQWQRLSERELARPAPQDAQPGSSLTTTSTQPITPLHQESTGTTTSRVSILESELDRALAQTIAKALDPELLFAGATEARFPEQNSWSTMNLGSDLSLKGFAALLQPEVEPTPRRRSTFRLDRSKILTDVSPQSQFLAHAFETSRMQRRAPAEFLLGPEFVQVGQVLMTRAWNVAPWPRVP